MFPRMPWDSTREQAWTCYIHLLYFSHFSKHPLSDSCKIRFKMNMFSSSDWSLIVWKHPKLNLKTRVRRFAWCVWVCVRVPRCTCVGVCVCRWSLWTSPLWFLAGSERQRLLVVKLLLVALPECTGRGEDRASLCHLAVARDVRRSLGMSIIARTEDELLLLSDRTTWISI